VLCQIPLNHLPSNRPSSSWDRGDGAVGAGCLSEHPERLPAGPGARPAAARRCTDIQESLSIELAEGISDDNLALSFAMTRSSLRAHLVGASNPAREIDRSAVTGRRRHGHKALLCEHGRRSLFALSRALGAARSLSLPPSPGGIPHRTVCASPSDNADQLDCAISRNINYILTPMIRNWPYGKRLALAQELGYSRRRPTLDDRLGPTPLETVIRDAPGFGVKANCGLSAKASTRFSFPT